MISDERYDNTVIKLDKQGFHPHFVYVQKVCKAEKLIYSVVYVSVIQDGICLLILDSVLTPHHITFTILDNCDMHNF